jgi:hypothetical protein
MKILIVPMEVPVPANSGGRVDVARRMRLLADSGHQLALLTWHNVARDGPLPVQTQAQLATMCLTQHVSTIRRSASESLRRLSRLWHMPSHVAARWVTLDRAAVLSWARSFGPDVLLLDGLYGVAAVRWLARQLGVPWVYRSHNIEHVYMRHQQRRATTWAARLALGANLIGLKRTEQATVRDAACTYDISLVDAAHWQRAGCERVHWLPTLVDADFEAAMAAAAARPPVWDLVYFGNLNTPNNVQAVEWLVTQVLPRLPERSLTVAVAGSRPSEEVRRLVAADPRVSLLADPPSIPDIAGAARLLVNTVQAGSGVNLKSVEMLFSTAHLVSTPAGVQGLPADAAACFDVCEDAQAFALAVQHRLGQPAADQTPRQAARAPFAPAGAARLLAQTLPAAIARGRP